MKFRKARESLGLRAFFFGVRRLVGALGRTMLNRLRLDLSVEGDAKLPEDSSWKSCDKSQHSKRTMLNRLRLGWLVEGDSEWPEYWFWKSCDKSQHSKGLDVFPGAVFGAC